MLNEKEIITLLKTLKEQYPTADGIKIYYATPTDYCIKIIGDGKVITANRNRERKRPRQDKPKNRDN